jgi:hypothetical protein
VKIALVVVGTLVAVWLLGAMVQGVLLKASIASHRIWLFNFWFEKFALGVLVGFVLGCVAGFAVLRRRTA